MSMQCMHHEAFAAPLRIASFNSTTMRATTRLLAAVQRSGHFLEAGAPTGLTGLKTHGSPRTALLYLYSSTLEKLKQFPEHSVYRQSTEALTKHRMQIVEAIKPEGLAEWQGRVQDLLQQHPEAFRKIPVSGTSSAEYNIVWKEGSKQALVDGEEQISSNMPKFNEGPKTQEDLDRVNKAFAKFSKDMSVKIPQIEAEPALSSEQIGEIETKINAGLIEEVIEVAQNERNLANVLYESQVWEDLEEKPVEGQWEYHGRDRHTAGTEAKN